jgi:ABC-type oligopeptide transport system substrate-binding subunit
MKFWVYLFALAFLLLEGGAGYTQNLIPNGDFEMVDRSLDWDLSDPNTFTHWQNDSSFRISRFSCWRNPAINERYLPGVDVLIQIIY